MKNLIKLVGNHTLFVAGADDRVSAANILEEMTTASPIGLMFRGAGTLALNTGDKVLNVPYRKVRLDDPHITFQNVKLEHEGIDIPGVGIGLPDDMVRLHSAFVAARDGMPYNWDIFLKQYLGDLEKIGSLFFDMVDTAVIDGMQGQVITHPQVGEDEVGLNVATMKRLHKALIAAGHEELKPRDTLEGMWILLQRYPVVSPTGGRWVKLVMIRGAASDKILVNARTWKEMHDGDEDGDSGYIGIGREANFGELGPEVKYPELKVIERDDLPETRTADPIQTVMNMRARDLIGPQHNFFHTLARAASTRDGVDFHETYDKVFDIYHPMAEGVFDKRKDEGGSEDFAKLVEVMETHLEGGRIEVEAFRPFISTNQFTNLSNILESVSYSTRSSRTTAFGRILAGGNTAKDRAFAFIADALVGQGISPDKMLEALQKDAVGEEILRIPLPQKSNQQQSVRKPIKMEVKQVMEKVNDVFEGITFRGKRVLQVLDSDTMTDGTTRVKVRVIPVWRPTMRCVDIVLTIPKMDKVDGAKDHRILTLDNLQPRIFTPVFRMVGENLVMDDVKVWYSRVIATGIQEFAKMKMRNLEANRMQKYMDRHIRSAVRDLVAMNTKDPDTAKRELLIRMFEYRVEINSKSVINQEKIQMVDGDNISTVLSEYEVMLTKLNELGFDIATTSKNKPGTIVTKAWKHGISRFTWATNPFANFLDMKRRVEIREIRKALELANPIEPPLRTMGCRLPEELKKVLTVLDVAVMDLKGLNVFEGSDGPFCFDTLLVCPSGVEKLKLKHLYFHAEDKEQMLAIVGKMKNEGISGIEIEEVIESMGEGLHHVAYDITANNPIEDVGKIKAAVGPIKGVMNPVPFQLFDENGKEIDIIVPHDTIIRKRAVDALQYMMAANAGTKEIDPDNQVILDVVKSIVVMEDGELLGEAIVGPLPFFRPVQTGRSTADIRTGMNGVKVQYHTMIMAGGVDFSNTPTWASEDFAQVVNTRIALKALIEENAKEDE